MHKSKEITYKRYQNNGKGPITLPLTAEALVLLFLARRLIIRRGKPTPSYCKRVLRCPPLLAIAFRVTRLSRRPPPPFASSAPTFRMACPAFRVACPRLLHRPFPPFVLPTAAQ